MLSEAEVRAIKAHEVLAERMGWVLNAGVPALCDDWLRLQAENNQLAADQGLAIDNEMRLRKENAALRERLQDLCDLQNGPPLPKYAADWTAAYDRAMKLLEEKP